MFSTLGPIYSVDGELCGLPQLLYLLEFPLDSPLIGGKIDHRVDLLAKHLLINIPNVENVEIIIFVPGDSRPTADLSPVSRSQFRFS